MPERAAAIKPLAHEPPHELLESDAILDRDVLNGGDVTLDVERRIVEPHRLGHVQRCRHDPLAEPRSGVEAGGDVPPELVERRQRPVAGALEHEHLARVARGSRRVRA